MHICECADDTWADGVHDRFDVTNIVWTCEDRISSTTPFQCGTSDIQILTRRLEYAATHAAAANELSIGSVDDGVHMKASDVLLDKHYAATGRRLRQP